MARYAMLSGLAPVIIFSVIGLPPLLVGALQLTSACAVAGLAVTF